MKKALISIIFFLLLIETSAFAKDIKIYLNDEEVICDIAPFIKNDRVLVPVRAIFEALGAKVDWDEYKREVVAVKGDNTIKLKIDSDTIYCGIINSENMPVFNSKRYTDVPATIIDDRTYVPARAVSESMNCEVFWNEIDYSVAIKTFNEGEDTIFYASADDYFKLYSVDSNGVNRKKLSDVASSEVYYDNGWVYYLGRNGFLYKITENGEFEEQITNFKTKVINIDDGVIYCLMLEEKNSGTLYRISDEITDLGFCKHPKYNNGYIYFNKENDTRMFALNTLTDEETAVDMSDDITLSPYNCHFYGDYILVEDGYWYNTICRFDADGKNKTYITDDAAIICDNQEFDDKVLYINGDKGQDVYYADINGNGSKMVVDMSDDCPYVKVLLQKGDYVYYKNMYRKEIYRSNINNGVNMYIGYGDDVKIFNNKLFLEYKGLYVSELDAQNQRMIYDKEIDEYFLKNENVFARNKDTGNIVKISLLGNNSYLTNDKASVWTTNIN